MNQKNKILSDYVDKNGLVRRRDREQIYNVNNVNIVKKKPEPVVTQSNASSIVNTPYKSKSMGHVHFKTGRMDKDEYTHALEAWGRLKELDLPQAERERVYEAFDNNLSIEEKQSALVRIAIGDYYYSAVNRGHNLYKIYRKEPIEPYTDIVDEVLSEMYGRGWKKAWDVIERLKKN